MEEAAARIAQDNCELACCFIQKTAVEKAGPEMDKRLATVSVHVGCRRDDGSVKGLLFV